MPDMRFAPPAALRLADHGGGLNQTSVRAYNERLVISLLRHHDMLSRQSITQISGLSTQTVSVITNALEQDHLVATGEPVRGKVGPPSRLLSLNPKGAYAIGIKIGTKSTDMVLMDFVGTVIHHIEQQYGYPERKAVMTWIEAHLVNLMNSIPADHRKRMVGIGVSLPEDIDTWPKTDWKSADRHAWAEINIEERIEEISGLSVYIQNDVTAAAGAEIIFGAARELGDFAYFFVGAKTSSRLILNHHIHSGRQTGQPIASLSSLETQLKQDGNEGAAVWARPDEWAMGADTLQNWTRSCAQGIIERCQSLSTFVDLDTVVVDGRFPENVREKICFAVEAASSQSTVQLNVLPGRVGAFAKSIGAASLPFHSRFMVDEAGLAG